MKKETKAIIILAIVLVGLMGGFFYGITYGEYREPIEINKTIQRVYRYDYKLEVLFDDGSSMIFFDDESSLKLVLYEGKNIRIIAQEERWFFNTQSRYRLILVEEC